MGDLAAGRAWKIVYCHIFLLFLLIPLMNLRGQTNPQYFLVVINKSNRKVQIDKSLENDIYESHRQNLQSLLEGGSLTLIGFLEAGGGIFIGRKKDMSRVSAVLEKDRIVKSGIYDYVIKVFNKRSGKICRYEKGCGDTSYRLIKFLANLNKETVKIAATMEYRHQLYLEEAYAADSILLSGRFEDKDGDFVIYRGKDFKNFAYNDPGVTSDYLITEFFAFTGCSASQCREP